MLSAQKLVEQEIHPEEIISRLKDSVDHSRGFLIPEDLDHLAKGGRLTPMAAKLAGMLKILKEKSMFLIKYVQCPKLLKKLLK